MVTQSHSGNRCIIIVASLQLFVVFINRRRVVFIHRTALQAIQLGTENCELDLRNCRCLVRSLNRFQNYSILKSIAKWSINVRLCSGGPFTFLTSCDSRASSMGITSPPLLENNNGRCLSLSSLCYYTLQFFCASLYHPSYIYI